MKINFKQFKRSYPAKHHSYTKTNNTKLEVSISSKFMSVSIPRQIIKNYCSCLIKHDKYAFLVMREETENTGVQYSNQVLEQLLLLSITWQIPTTPIRQWWILSHCGNKSAFVNVQRTRMSVHKAKRRQKAMSVLTVKNIVFWSFWKLTWSLYFKTTVPKNEVYKKEFALGKQLLQPSDSYKSWRSQEVP